MVALLRDRAGINELRGKWNFKKWGKKGNPYFPKRLPQNSYKPQDTQYIASNGISKIFLLSMDIFPFATAFLLHTFQGSSHKFAG